MDENNLIMNDSLPDDEVEVELASPWRRIGAVFLNSLFNILITVPFIAWMIFGRNGYAESASDGVVSSASRSGNDWIFILMLLTWLVYGCVQLYFMSKDGQSLGKKVLGIRVLKTDGTNPGFFGTVFMREVALSLVVAALVLLAIIFLGETVAETVGNLLQAAFSCANLIMLFISSKDRRTIPDYLADTVVVRLPKK